MSAKQQDRGERRILRAVSFFIHWLGYENYWWFEYPSSMPHRLKMLCFLLMSSHYVSLVICGGIGSKSQLMLPQQELIAGHCFE